MAQIIRADGSVEEVEMPKKDGLPFMQQVVGGYIEIVRIPDGRLMVLNEEGKLLRLPLNTKATALYNNLNDVIVGDVLVGTRKEIK